MLGQDIIHVLQENTLSSKSDISQNNRALANLTLRLNKITIHPSQQEIESVIDDIAQSYSKHQKHIERAPTKHKEGQALKKNFESDKEWKKATPF